MFSFWEDIKNDMASKQMLNNFVYFPANSLAYLVNLHTNVNRISSTYLFD
jgi:hypothetical protein